MSDTLKVGDKAPEIEAETYGGEKIRITSYNVCYTKLLRMIGVGEGCGSAAEFPHILKPSIKYSPFIHTC